MDTNEQPQQPPDARVEQPPTLPGTYPPPYYPSPYYPPPSFPVYPPTTAMTDPTALSPAEASAQPAQERLPRSQALDLLSRLKATLVVGSVIAFGAFAALAATHITGVTSRANSSSTPSPYDSQGAPMVPSTNNDGGGFFNESPSSGFGIGPPSSQGPASGTSVS